jgi:hypothetical protein
MATTAAEILLPTVVRWKNGELFEGTVCPSEHRRLHIEMLHRQTSRLIELAAAFRNDKGSLVWITRKREDHYLLGGGSGSQTWLEDLLALAAHHHAKNRELFISPVQRSAPGPGKRFVLGSQWLWVDVDDPQRFPALWAFFNEPTKSLPHGRLPHLVIETGGIPAEQSDHDETQIRGGLHAFFALDRLLPAVTLITDDGAKYTNPAVSIPDDSDALNYADRQTGEMLEGRVINEIERANLRLIHALGFRYDAYGKQIPTVADPACSHRHQPMRLAGSRHGETGRYARVIYADFTAPPFSYETLVGDLPDPRDQPAIREHRSGDSNFDDDDPYKRIPILDAYERLTGWEGSTRHKVRCPHRDHPDNDPSCDLKSDYFICRSCSAAGGIYQLASAVLGGPTKHLRGDAFKSAKNLVIQVFGEL